jgi:uncharacterized alpha-E superfamily protein
LSSLLARFAENIFWLARYVERAENLARIFDVSESFERDMEGGHDWLPVVQLYNDEERFFEQHPKATSAAVIQFYLLDRDNPTSILAAIWNARENARSLRHLISTEMWHQLNIFYSELSALRKRDVSLRHLSRVCQRIKENCQTHTGITEGTLYRDETWCFYQIGKYIERADQTSRLLDIRYHRIVGNQEEAAAPVDVSQWNALLRSVAAYHAFRRTHPSDLKPQEAAAFLLFEEDFPRSLVCCLQYVEAVYSDLENLHGLPCGPDIRKRLKALNKMLHPTSASRARRDIKTLHKFVDSFQSSLIGLTAENGRVFFAHGQ